MMMEISRSVCAPIDLTRVEVVERKGVGHPDTLADSIAESFSVRYSRWAAETFGYVPHHWVDKCMVIGGESQNRFGHSSMIEPIKVLVVGKVTDRVGSTPIPIADFASQTASECLGRVLFDFDVSECAVTLHTNTAVGSGRPPDWYRPTVTQDFEAIAPANDTVTCSAYAPLSKLERLVLAIENELNSPEYKASMPQTGTDIKVLATRVGGVVDVTLCVPAISRLIPNRVFYDEFKQSIVRDVEAVISTEAEEFTSNVRLNTRDSAECIYMTHHGSAIDTGDVGVVGRGNRMNGVISPMRETGLEAPWGKNPTYHAGKIYTVAAHRIADEIYNACSAEVRVNIISDNGRPLQDPRLVSVSSAANGGELPRDLVELIIDRQLNAIPQLCRDFWETRQANALLTNVQPRDGYLWKSTSVV